MNNNPLVLGHFLPSSLLQQSTPIRRLTSTSSDSGDSGVDPVRKLFVFLQKFIIASIDSPIDKNEKYLLAAFHQQLDQKSWLSFFKLMAK